MWGLDIFKEHFKGFEDYYAIIGGTACSVILNEVGINFRRTHDIDMVIIIENLDEEFAQKIWEFVKVGRYGDNKKEQRNQAYRFSKPANENYPKMIEVFSRKPTSISLEKDSHLAPIHISDEISSLSAILLDDNYYDFLKSGVKRVNNIAVLDELHLIPFKAKAWCELRKEKQMGRQVDSKSIKKHRNDIATLISVISPIEKIELPNSIKSDMDFFLNEIAEEIIDENTTNIKGMTKELYCNSLRSIYF